jgi:hypothetical protein
MRPSLRWRLAGSAVFLLCLAPGAAFADALSDAKDLFVQGRDLRARGDCVGAIALFRKAHDLYPAGLGTLRNIAECQEAVGQFASARRTWLDLKRELATDSSPRYEGWAHDADQAAGRLAPKLATIKINLSAVRTTGEAAPADGVEVTLNGEPIATVLSGTPLERDPGRYVVRVAGRLVSAPEERTVDLREGEAKSVALRVVLADLPHAGASLGEAPPAAALAPAPENDEHEDTTRRTLGWVAIATGAASTVGFAISVGLYVSARNDADKLCGGSIDMCKAARNDAQLQATTDQGHTAATWIDVFGAVGALGLAGGALLLLTSNGHDTHPAVAVSPTGVWAVGRF